jgi:diguanylate cyclase (GGDEF)-like protein
MVAAGNWSAQQLAEFLAAISTAENEEVAKRRAVERAMEALEAEVGALVLTGGVDLAIGFPPNRVPEEEIVAIAEAKGGRSLEVQGLGPCTGVSIPIEGDLDGHFVLARSKGREFGPLETNLLRAMGRVLSLSVTTLRTLAAEQERHRLLGQLSRIQGSLSHHAPLQEILDSISAGARDLLDSELAGVLLLDPNNPDELVPRSGVGMTTTELEAFGRVSIGEGVSGRAVELEEVVVEQDFQARFGPLPDPIRSRVQATIAAPIREGDRVVGALAVASEREGHRFTEAEREALTAFADHAGLALTDARLTDQVERALRDPLTGLPNRPGLRERLEAMLAHPAGPDGSIAVLVLDLDSFKSVNDRLGPTAGDELLRAVADRLREIVGPDDTVARVGSDEFAILPAEPDAAEGIAERVLAQIRGPVDIGGRQIRVSASIGLAADGENAAELLRNAHLAMSSAQKQGGMRSATYEPRMHSELVERAELGDDLLRALERGELEAFFQPKVELSTSRVTGLEALVRWHHPARGLLSPGVFLELAEANGQMASLTETVLEQALEVASSWWPAGRRLEVSVNLAPAIFDEVNGELPGMVESLLDRYRLPGRALEFEVTEEAAMRDDELAAGTLTSLAELGVGLSIDDFGTGYSSLSRIKSLPLDELKIDRSFVMELNRDSGDVPIVRAAIELAHQMGLQVVAEGVETESAWQCLHELGCDEAQGFLIAKPMPRDELASWLERWERMHHRPRMAARAKEPRRLRAVERSGAV